MTQTPGTRLGKYELGALLGKGGMGEVYRARDTELDREVAIKVLPEEVANDAERLARFEREAKALAALDHPNVATLFGMERDGEVPFLVMQLAPGEDLAARIARGALPLEEAVPIFVQIAEGLEAAHEKGIVHRDLKPANVMVSPEGAVKILDFGLAKAFSAEEKEGSGRRVEATHSPTLTLAATMRGEILGTAAYMSPEQARGKPVDRRTDLWAFGVCLYEALSGVRPFAGEDAAQTLARVLEREIDLGALPADTPPSIRRLLRRCLERDPRERLRDVADARLELKDRSEGAIEAIAAAATAAPPRRLFVALALVALLSAAVAALSWLRPRGEPSFDTRLVRFADDRGSLAVFSATPLAAVYPGGDEAVTLDYDPFLPLRSRSLDSLGTRVLAGTEGALAPFFSSDGRRIGYFLEGAVMARPKDGGIATVVSREVAGSPRGAALLSDGSAVVSVQGVSGWRLWTTDGSTGGERELFPLDEAQRPVEQLWPQVLGPAAGPWRDEELIVFTEGRPGDWRVVAGSLRTGERKDLAPGMFGRVAREHLVFARDGVIWAVRLAEDLSLMGPILPLAENVLTHDRTGAAQLAVGGEVLTYTPTDYFLSPGRIGAVLVDRQRREEVVWETEGQLSNVRLSPDEKRIAAQRMTDQPAADIWVYERARRIAERLTQNAVPDFSPHWISDDEIVHAGVRDGRVRVVVHALAGERDERVLDAVDDILDVVPGTRALVVGTAGGDLDLLPLDGRASEPLGETRVGERNASVSPNGRWIAIETNESGRFEIVVRPFPLLDGSKVVVSTNGGTEPAWSRDGTELFYREGRAMMAVDVGVRETERGPELIPSAPTRLFEGDYQARPAYGRAYDVTRDGRFLMVKQIVPARFQSVVVLNWTEALKQGAPTR